MVRQSGSAQRREDYGEVGTRRNPYLVDYERQMDRPRRETNGRGRRPVAYGSRMAQGSGQAPDEGTKAMGRGAAPDIRMPLDGQFFQEDPMPEEEYLSERRTSMPARDADYTENSPRREVTADMFNGYRDHEPARKGKIVQVPIPSDKKTRRRRPQEDAWQRQDRDSARRETMPRPRRGIPQERASRPYGESAQERAARPYGEPTQERVSRPRREPMQERAARPRREASQTRIPQQPREAWRQEKPTRRQSVVRQPAREHPRNVPYPRGAARQSRRQRVLLQRLILGAWIVCILLFAVYFAIKNHQAKSTEGALPVSGGQQEKAAGQQPSGTFVQGISADEFATHPEWTEDFLTPNEYSRPGEPLESVKNIFVHYTANPGTSAAQNRSYFEWQKDTHEASVSAHFIIGYEGEIIQCVPLDEIAYAVMTRNYDSVSIECCYLAEDGSFTQETYNSLISLLAWLTDIYDLDAEDILRHYDCGGKKCPLYYTEHEDAWEQLKKDVDKL